MKSNKPLGRKAYGSIPHLIGSRQGPGDHHVHPGQHDICTFKARDKHDLITVTEKLDGCNVAIARVEGKILALTRSGYPARKSKFLQHRMFDEWVEDSYFLWQDKLSDGECFHGEWLAIAHGTRYDLHHGPLVLFDLTRNGTRVPVHELIDRSPVETPHVLSMGPAFTIEAAIEATKKCRHGAIDPVEGAVWRVERNGKFDFMAKWVRPDKIDGKFLSDISGGPEIWNWRP